MPYDVGVRQYLQGKGVSSGDIGYDQNSGNVTVRGQNFYKPELNMAGTTYSNKNNLDNAYNNYSKALPTIQKDGTTAYGTSSASPAGELGATLGKFAATINGPKFDQSSTQPPKPPNAGYTNPYTQMIGDLIKHLSDTSNAPQQDIYSSPQYAAAKSNQDRMSADAIRHASESAAGAGLGHSTVMTDRTQRIQGDSDQQLATQLVPQIQAQLAQQRQQELNNQENQLRDYMTLGQQADAQNNTNRNYDLAKSAQVYSESPDNPNNAGQLLNNQLTQLKLSDYPAQSQAAAKQTQQDLATGKINQEAAQFKLDQLKDPNSPVNQAAAIDTQLKQIDLKYADATARAKLDQIQKQIAQIGAAPYKSEADKQLDQVKLDTAKAELAKLQNPTPKPKTPGSYKTDPHFAEDIAHLQASPTDAAKLDSNPQPFIDAYGYDGYLALRKAAGLQDPTAP